MTLCRSLLLLAALSIFPRSCFAQSPKEELVGIWSFKRGFGGPCATEIRELVYSFHKDGHYSGKATLRVGGNVEYRGTYSATDTNATVYTDGFTVGPFPYRIHGDVLNVVQPEFHCEVELVREDY